MSFHATYPFKLPPLPPNIEAFDENFIKLLIDARTELAELKGYSRVMPDPMLLLSPTILRESVASSSIENINTTVAEVLQAQLFPETERPETNKEVLRYREALLNGYRMLKNNMPLSERLINSIHGNLLPGDSSGIRRLQNKIINTATGAPIYTPPIASDVPKLLSNWAKFVNDETSDLDPLIRCAIGHYQFEAIHPFLDGNGRTGRIVMVLMLARYKILDAPVLFISGYINSNRSEYYRLLLGVSMKGNWGEYLTFMIKGFAEQGKNTKQLLFQIMNLFDSTKSLVKEKHQKVYTRDLIEVLFTYPIITPAKLSEVLGVHRATATKYLNTLREGKILTDRIIGKYHLYINEKLVSLINR
ncbi:MAG: Fic family protein [Ignavibacteriota bacterium]